MEVSTFGKRAIWLVFALCLAIYVLTLCPTVYWDDAGELIAACYTLGIPHPPGHPLYVLIGKLFTLIPLGSIAWRVNFMSALFGAFSCMLVYKIISDRLDELRWKSAAALGGALFFAFAPTMWEQSTVAETSTLHSFFMMALTLLAFRMASGKILFGSEAKSLCLFSFLYGLSLTNHVAGVFFFPAFAYIFIATFGRRIFAPRLLAGMLGSFFFGLLVYVYLPVRSLSNPPIDWGNPENLKNFLWVITAKQYAPNLVANPSALTIGANLVVRARELLHQFTIVGCTFGLVGVWTLYRRERRVVIFSLLVIGVLFYIGLNGAFISAYFIPAVALMCVWIGVGLQRVLEWVARLWERVEATSVTAALRRALCGMLAASFVLPLGLHFREMDRSDARYALRYGEQILERLPQNSALFTVDGYALFILWYLIYCEHKRPDVMVMEPTWLSAGGALYSQIMEQYPDLRLPPSETVASYLSGDTDAESIEYLVIKAVLDTNYPVRPIFWGMIPNNLPFYENLIPEGILYRYSAQPVAMGYETLSANEDFWMSEREFLQRDPAMKKDKVALEIYPVELNNQGLMFEALGRDDLSRRAIERALDFNPEYPISRYNLGRLEARAGNHDEAIREYQYAVRGNPHMAVAYFGLGNAYRSTGRFAEAFLAYRKAARLYPDYYEAVTALGQLNSLVGQNEDAAEKFLCALNVEPTYVFALRGLASAYLQMGRLDESKEVLDKAIALEPNSAPGLYALAKYYARTGSGSDAASTLRRSVEIGGKTYLETALADEDLKKLAEDILTSGGQG